MERKLSWKKQKFVPMASKEIPSRRIESIEEIPQSALYKVFWNGNELPVYHTEFFDYVLPVVHDEKQFNFEICLSKEFEKCVVRPLRNDRIISIEEKKIKVVLKHMEKIVIEIDNDLLNPLYILCQDYIEKPKNVTYDFKKDHVYNVGTLNLKSGDVVYIEEGSVVCGKIYSRMQNDIEICGNGILYGSVWHGWDENCGDQMIMLILGERVYIHGITIVDGGSWNIVPVACTDVKISDINILSKVITSDGIDIVGCQDVKVQNCFIRTNDDCISIKGCNNFDPAGSCDTKSVLVEDCIFWNAEFGNVLEIGYETQCDEISNIYFKNCEVLHCEYEGNQSGGVLTIHNADRANVHKIIYENIRIEDAQEKFVDIKILDSKYSTDKKRGMISDIMFKNIEIVEGDFPVSIIRGFEMKEELCRPNGIMFDNLMIHGKKINSVNEMRMVKELTDDIIFC